MKDINCIELFKTPVFYYNLDLNIKALNKFCYSYQKKNKKSRVISNVGSYQSNNLDLNHKLLKPIVKGLFQNPMIVSFSLGLVWGYLDFQTPKFLSDFLISTPN